MAQETHDPLNDDHAAGEGSADDAVEASSSSPADAAPSDVSAAAQPDEPIAGVALDTPPAAPGAPFAAEASGIDLLHDVNLEVTIELGRAQMFVEDVLRLGEGSVVELDKLAGDPVDVYVNQRLVARGEVLVLNDNFCIRISEIVADLEEEAQALAADAVPAG